MALAYATTTRFLKWAFVLGCVWMCGRLNKETRVAIEKNAKEIAENVSVTAPCARHPIPTSAALFFTHSLSCWLGLCLPTQSRQQVRTVRQHAMKKVGKSKGTLSEDDVFRLEKEVLHIHTL